MGKVKSGRAGASGFTLIELMIVLLVIGILTAIAYPSYVGSIVKGNRANAQAMLMDAAQRQQQFLLDNRAYASSVADLGISVPDEVSDFYVISIAASDGPPPSFTITAAPKAGGRQASDGTLSIDNVGTKTPTGKW